MQHFEQLGSIKVDQSKQRGTRRADWKIVLLEKNVEDERRIDGK